MKRHIDYKVPGGKLLRVDIETEKGLIKDIRITGDFFIHPEEGISEIEEGLKGIMTEDISEALGKILESKKIQVIGFGIKDLENAILSMCRK